MSMRGERGGGCYLHPHAGAAGPAPEEVLAFSAGEEAFEDSRCVSIEGRWRNSGSVPYAPAGCI